MPQQNSQPATVAVDIKGVGRVHFPAEFTPDQIERAIESDILPQVTQPKPATPEPPGRGERFMRGVKDIGQGVMQGSLQFEEATNHPNALEWLNPRTGEIEYREPRESRGVPIAKQYTADVTREIKDYESRRGPDAGFDWMRLGGNVVATAPTMALGGGAGWLGRALSGGAQGGIIGASQFVKDSDSRLGQAGVGAFSGALFSPVVGFLGDKAGTVVRKVAGWLRAAVATPKTADDLMREVPELVDVPEAARVDLIAEAQRQLAKTGDLNLDQLARKANLVANGVTPIKSMVTRNPQDWAMERNLSKLTGPTEQLRGIGQQMTDVYTANDEALATRLRSLGQGLPQGTQEAHGMTVMRSIDDLADASQKQVGELYEQIRQAKGDNLASDARNLVQALDELKDVTYTEKLVGSVTNRLRRLGMVDAEGNVTTNTLTVTQAEELRKFVNRLPNDYGKRDIIRAIDADVLSGAGEDAFAGARSAAEQRFAMLGNPATQRALNTLGELTQGKTAQNFIKSQIIDAADQDVQTLVATLSKLPPDQGQQAIGALRAGLLQHLESKAINPNSGQFSGASLNRAIKDIGEDKLIRVLGVEQYRQLQSLARAGLDATYQPPYAAVNSSNTAPMLLSLSEKLRYGQATPVVGQVIETAKRVQAENQAQRRLSEALQAGVGGELPPVSPRVIQLTRALQAASAPASPAVANELRRPAKQKAKDRQGR